MKVVRTENGNDGNGKFATFGISAAILGLYLVGLLIYSWWISDEKCLRYFGRRGMGEDCSIDKTAGLVHLGFIAAFALLFLIIGIGNIIINRRIKNKS